MRNLDLDQYWPMPPPRLADSGAGSVNERSQSFVPPPLLRASAPPPLPLRLADGVLEPAPELLEAALAGWLEADAHDDPEQHEPAVTANIEPETFAERRPLAAREPSTTPLAPEADGSIVPPAAARSRRDFTPLIWGGTGFAAGMLAWHVVGFWSFLSNVVLNTNDPRAQTLEGFLPHLSATVATQKAPSPVSSVDTTHVQPAGRKGGIEAQFACVALAIDRVAGSAATKVTGCKGGAGDLRDAGFNKRTDKLVVRPRLQDPVAWTGSTAVQVPAAGDPAHAAPAAATPVAETGTLTGTLSDADLKLDMAQPELTDKP